MATLHLKESPTEMRELPVPARDTSERVVSTKDLLGCAHRIWIQHAAERYLLQVTRSGNRPDEVSPHL